MNMLCLNTKKCIANISFRNHCLIFSIISLFQSQYRFVCESVYAAYSEGVVKAQDFSR